MNTIDKILKEELIRERKNLLTENILSLQHSKNKKDLMENSLSTIFRLLDEGYTGEEIASTIEEQDGFLSKIFGMAKGGFKGGIWSQLKEMAIKWLLKAFGIQSPAKEMLATAVADLELKKLLGIFKSEQGCIDGVGSIVDTLLELAVGRLQVSMGLGNIMSDSVRNVLMDSVRNSNVGESISRNLICNRIHKISPTQPNNGIQYTQTSTA